MHRRTFFAGVLSSLAMLPGLGWLRPALAEQPRWYDVTLWLMRWDNHAAIELLDAEQFVEELFAFVQCGAAIGCCDNRILLTFTVEASEPLHATVDCFKKANEFAFRHKLICGVESCEEVPKEIW